MWLDFLMALEKIVWRKSSRTQFCIPWLKAELMSFVNGLLYCWDKNKQYGPKLVADLNEEQMVFQPAPEGKAPSNHPAWVFSHLNVYLPVMQALIKGDEFEDPREHTFGMLSKPEGDIAIYASKEELITTFVEGHVQVAQLLAEANDDVFAQPVRLERWAPIMPTVGVALPYLMLNHENQHFGQISAWRRIQGMPNV